MESQDNISRAEKLRRAGIERYGSEAAWRQHQREAGKKASRPGTGGFHHLKKTDPDKLHEISQRAHEARWSKDKQDRS